MRVPARFCVYAAASVRPAAFLQKREMGGVFVAQKEMED
jgi:hypothetical protein